MSSSALQSSVARDNLAVRGEAGVTLIVRCHNSAKRLPATLAHLANQRVPADVPWEVLLVDNASTDNTAILAEQMWPKNATGNLRVVNEPMLGYSHSFYRGLREARFEYLSIVDDDNWVCPDWVRLVADTLDSHPDVALCGGPGIPVCETAAPAWFSRFALCFAVGPQADASGYLNGNCLWGAGLTIRKSALRDVVSKGFRSVLTGRRGRRLTSGEDSELCIALRAAGWKQWYDPRLTFQHYMPKDRLRWSYLRGLFRRIGASRLQLALYEECQQDLGKFTLARGRTTKAWKTVGAIRKIIRNARPLLGPSPFGAEGDDSSLEIESGIGQLQALWLPGPGLRRQRQIVRQFLSNLR